MPTRFDASISIFLTAALTLSAVMLYTMGDPQAFGADQPPPPPLIPPDVATGTTIGAGVLQGLHTLRLLLRRTPAQ